MLRSKLLANATQLSSGGIGQIPGGGARVFRAPKVALSLAIRSAPEAGSTPIDRLWEKTGAGGGGRTLTALRPRDFESEQIANGTVGRNRQQHEIIGGEPEPRFPPFVSNRLPWAGSTAHFTAQSRGGVRTPRLCAPLNIRPVPMSAQFFEKCFRFAMPWRGVPGGGCPPLPKAPWKCIRKGEKVNAIVSVKGRRDRGERHRPFRPSQVGGSSGSHGQLEMICNATPGKRFPILWR